MLENVALPAYVKDGADINAAQRILKQVKLADLADRKVKHLSGGEKQRVAIARELMKNPEVIFCDEPTSALDTKSAKTVMEILRVLSKRRTVVIVTHDTSLITENDTVLELDKGELVSVSSDKKKKKPTKRDFDFPKLSFKNSFKIAFDNVKNKPGRFLISVLSLVIAGTLLLTTLSGAVSSGTDGEFQKLVETYGENILDISIISSFMSASGADGSDSGQGGNVDQNIGGLYEKYQSDDRVEFIITSQAFENIKLTLDGKTHTVEKTGNSPVLTKLISGSIPSGDEYSVVIPLKFAESIGLTPETAIGKRISFSATIFKWINNSPIEKPVKIDATVCGVADNTVVTDYEGQTYEYTIDDSFFFNKSANEELRRQAGIENEPANFTIRAKTPEDLISLKDELNRSGIVPLGRFELVEDIVRLNEQTSEQSGSASAVIGVLAVALAAAIFAMTAVLRKREYAVYKISGYTNGCLAKISASETVYTAVAAVLLMLLFSPLLNMATKAMFASSILSVEKLGLGALIIIGISVLAFGVGALGYTSAKISSMLKSGDKS